MKHRHHIFFFLIVAFFILLSIGSEEGESTPNTLKYVAYNLSTKHVKDSLVTPSTAIFPKHGELMKHIIVHDDFSYDINSWVDSQNSFGARIRTKFSCKIIFTKTDINDLEYICESLKFE